MHRWFSFSANFSSSTLRSLKDLKASRAKKMQYHRSRKKKLFSLLTTSSSLPITRFSKEVKKQKALKFCFCRPESLSWSESTDMTLWSWTQRIMQKFNMIQRWFHALRSNANAGSMLFARTQSIHDNSEYRFSLLQRWVNSYNTCSKTDGNDMLTLGSAHQCRRTEGSRTKDTIYWRASNRTVFLAWWLCLDSCNAVTLVSATVH